MAFMNAFLNLAWIYGHNRAVGPDSDSPALTDVYGANTTTEDVWKEVCDRSLLNCVSRPVGTAAADHAVAGAEQRLG